MGTLRTVEMVNNPLLVTALQAAQLLGLSERGFHKLRTRDDFRQTVPEVRLGARSVRWRTADLDAFARSIATTEREPEPAQLAASRARRKGRA